MRSKFFGIGLLVITALAPFATWTQEAATRAITIHVTDPVGTAIERAHIRLVPPTDAGPALGETDELGNLSLNLKAGSYALSVSEPGFKLWSERIYVPTDVECSVSPLYPVVMQIGDTSGPVMVYPAGSLVLTANAYHPAVALSAADFRSLPHITIKVHNGDTDRNESYSGVPLVTLLAMVNAPIGKNFQKEALASYLLACGSGGDSADCAVLSLAEADPSIHKGQVLVADARDGQPLAKSGGFELIVPGDSRPVRWVPKLHSISLQGAR
jgi:hypothetical protein